MSEDNAIFKGPAGEFAGVESPTSVELEQSVVVKPAVKEGRYFDKGVIPPKEKPIREITARRGSTPTGQGREWTVINERRVPVRAPKGYVVTAIDKSLKRNGPVTATAEPVIQNLDIDSEKL